MLLEFLVLLSALLAWAAFPPLGWGWLAPLALAPLFAAIRRVHTRRGAAFLGFSFGLLFYGSLTFWLTLIGFYVVVGLAVVMALFTMIFATALWSARSWEPIPWALTATGLWSAMELLRAQFPLGGFRWGDMGYALADIPWFRYAAKYVGTSGLTVVTVALAAGLAVVVADRKQPWQPLAGAGALALFVAVAGGLSMETADRAKLQVAVIQGSTPCPGAHCANENALTFEQHLADMSELQADRFDLVVWPESSAQYDGDPVTNPERREQIAEQARRLGAYVLVGTSRGVSDTEWINANVVFNPNGEIIGEYIKRHPVPFGESVPARDFFDFIPDIARVPRDMVPGDGPVVFEVGDVTMGSVISFEGGFAKEPREEVQAGAQFLVVATNESTYLETSAAEQFLRMTRMRAAENGVPLIHAALTGPSALFDANGNRLDETAIMSRGQLFGTISPRVREPTIYTRYGEWLAYLSVVAALVAVLLQRRLRSEPPTSDEVEPIEALT